jgi:hypothetical protein
MLTFMFILFLSLFYTCRARQCDADAPAPRAALFCLPWLPPSVPGPIYIQTHIYIHLHIYEARARAHTHTTYIILYNTHLSHTHTHPLSHTHKHTSCSLTSRPASASRSLISNESSARSLLVVGDLSLSLCLNSG